jgi:hypothetical protein
MATAAATAHRLNPANGLITESTKVLSQSCRYINGAIVAFVLALFAGEHHIPQNAHVGTTQWHRFLWIVCSALLALLLDRAQDFNNLVAYRRRHGHIESGWVTSVVFGKREFQFRLSWWLFYSKIGLTILNVIASIALLGPIVSRWTPSS